MSKYGVLLNVITWDMPIMQAIRDNTWYDAFKLSKCNQLISNMITSIPMQYSVQYAAANAWFVSSRVQTIHEYAMVTSPTPYAGCGKT